MAPGSAPEPGLPKTASVSPGLAAAELYPVDMEHEPAQGDTESDQDPAERMRAKLEKVRDLGPGDLSPEEYEALIAWGEQYADAS